MIDLENDIGNFEVTCWCSFLMESIGTRCQVDVLRLISFRSPAFYCLAFCLIALIDLDLSTSDFCSTKVYFTEGNLTWKIIVLIGYSHFGTIGYNLVLFTLSVFFSYASHFHCTIMVDLESDVGHFEVAGRCCFLMESISTWSQVQFFRLTSFRCPAFYGCAFCLVAFEDLDLCTCDFSTTETDLAEGHLTWKIIVFIRYCNFRTIGYNLVFFTLRVFLADIGHFHCSVMFDLEGDVRYFEVSGWSCFFMEGVDTRCQVDVLRLVSFRCPAFYWIAFCLIALVDLDLSSCDFCTTKVNFTESNGFGTIIVFIRYS